MLRAFVVASIVLAMGGCSTEPTRKASLETVSDSTVQFEKNIPAEELKTFGEAKPALYSEIIHEPFPQNLAIHFFDVGTGACQLIDCPGDDVILSDCGSSRYNSLNASEVVERINKIRGNRKINIVISHPHVDHLSIIKKLKSEDINHIYVGDSWEKYKKQLEKWASNIQKTSFPENAYYLPYNKLSCGSAEVGILTVNSSKPKEWLPKEYNELESEENANSLVLYLKYGKFSAIFPGDAEGITEESVLKNFKGLDVTVLSGSHHGATSGNSNSTNWIKETNPEIVVFNAKTNYMDYRHPRCETVNNYAKNADRLASTFLHKTTCGLEPSDSMLDSESTKKAIFSTYDQGSITIETDGDNFSVQCTRQPASCSVTSKVR